MNMGSLTTPSAIEKKFLGFDEGRIFDPSLFNFSFASAVVNPLYFCKVRSRFNSILFFGWNNKQWDSSVMQNFFSNTAHDNIFKPLTAV